MRQEKDISVFDSNQSVIDDMLQIELDTSLIDTTFSYYDNGYLRSMTIRNNRQSTNIRYYRNGNKKEENNYLDDTLNGPSLTYYENGQIEVLNNYSMGKPDGEYLWYRANGILKEKIIEVDGEITWLGKYNETGKLIYEATFKGGKVIKSQVY